ncbi:hypothetical protein [Saccharopolyspora sp. ASAGF58]|uniref:hypothetical protein n=1 Tax=Saccharopolyspora sp. ASAGF58 TaxID=2719023 RepID=UPI0014400930|nr:hypothetical protein [Saccharopolyspora sp. ASAGF58]QIZ35914.1 hypothetical protein FDZ84_15970 [Saccharopolyspora sp. ASAGF58]
MSALALLFLPVPAVAASLCMYLHVRHRRRLARKTADGGDPATREQSPTVPDEALRDWMLFVTALVRSPETVRALGQSLQRDRGQERAEPKALPPSPELRANESDEPQGPER